MKYNRCQEQHIETRRILIRHGKIMPKNKEEKSIYKTEKKNTPEKIREDFITKFIEIWS